MKRRALPHTQEHIRRKRRMRIARTLGAIILPLATAGGIVWGLWQPAVRIGKIVVAENGSLSRDELSASAQRMIAGTYAFMIPRDSVFFYPRNAIRERIYAEFPAVRSVRVHTEGLTALSLSIVERKPTAIWCGEDHDAPKGRSGENCYFMDEAGFLFRKAPELSEYVYLIAYGALNDRKSEIIGSRFQDPAALAFLARVRALLAQANVPTTEFRALPHGDYKLILQEGGEIIFNESQEPGTLVLDLSAAAEAEVGKLSDPRVRSRIRYIDMRFDGKAYISLFP